MMNFADATKVLRRNTRDHFPVILSAAAGIGTIATAYLAGKASFQAAEVIRLEEDGNPNPDPKERVKERTRLVWRLYIPTAISAGATIVCIVGSNRVEASKTLAAQTAFAVSERAYSEYRNKVIEQFGTDEDSIAKGKRKDKSIRDEIASERVKKSAPSQEILVTGPGNVLCCELYTDRYFPSDMESLRRAENTLNERMLRVGFCTMNEFYDLIGGSRLRHTSAGSDYGWIAERELMHLEFTTAMTDDNRPCLAFEYNYVEPL